MLFGAFGQSITMVLLTITTYLTAKVDALPFGGIGSSQAGLAAAVLLFVFNTFFAIGWLGSAWLYPAEITNLRVRGPSCGISTGGNWVSQSMNTNCDQP